MHNQPHQIGIDTRGPIGNVHMVVVGTSRRSRCDAIVLRRHMQNCKDPRPVHTESEHVRVGTLKRATDVAFIWAGCKEPYAVMLLRFYQL